MITIKKKYMKILNKKVKYNDKKRVEGKINIKKI
jgi:hypothetical protein